MKPITNCSIKRQTVNQQRHGVILLVVLGMLTLFSMLAVSYLVFTSRQRSAAFNINRSEGMQIDCAAMTNEAMMLALVGGNGASSSLWGHDILGDLYGMRDGVEAELTRPPFGTPEQAPESLLEGSFIRFPTDLYGPAVETSHPFQRLDSSAATERTYPHTHLDPNSPPPSPPLPPSFPYDDSLTGRLLTFQDGPLEGLTFSIARYFGNHSTATNLRNSLRGQVVIDVRPHLQRSIEIDGTTRTLKQWLDLASAGSFSMPTMFYDSANEPRGSFYINGRILNGQGIGWDLVRDGAAATSGPPDFNLNAMASATSIPWVPGMVPAGSFPMSGSAFSSGGSDIPVTMQGHYALYRNPRDTRTLSAEEAYLQDLPPGDTDESHDAPDYHNLWLAHFPADSALGVAAPSFVRPALLNWIINQKGNLGALSPTDREQILRAIQRSTLRPLPIAPIANGRRTGVLQLDYTNFTGSSSALILQSELTQASDLEALARVLSGSSTDTNGNPYWDVDNDGDGKADSVWIDAGLPLDEMPDGRLVKPLVAYRIEDLGARVNVNLAGNLAQTSTSNLLSGKMIGPIQQLNPNQLPAENPLTNPAVYDPPQDPVFQSGFGTGPAEINVRSLFSGPYVTGNGGQTLLVQKYNPIDVGGGNFFYSPGHLQDPVTSLPNDLLGAFRYPGRENLFFANRIQGLPFDNFGRSSVGLGVAGGLIVNRTSYRVDNATGPVAGGRVAGDIQDDPYEFDATASTSPDSPFTYSDLEPALRFSDVDRDLFASRLVDIINRHIQNPAALPNQLEDARRALAESITTASNSAAIPTGPMPMEWRADGIMSQTALEPQRVFAEQFELPPPPGPPTPPPTPEQIASYRNAKMWQLLPPEIRAGGRFDLNRPFGNGIDDDGDGVIDDPEEVFNLIEVFFAPSRWQTDRSDVTPGEPERNSREKYARDLFVVTMALIRDANNNTEFDFPNNYTGMPTLINGETFQQEYRAWKVAQWAVNVADYRDPDAIMTRFNYDPNPFDVEGWEVDLTNPASYRTVWGMEYPELTLEESIAFHDRRVRDTGDDDGDMAKRLVGGMFVDNDTDQWRIPVGSLYLELRSTRSPQELVVAPTSPGEDERGNRWAVPYELYTEIADPDTGETELMLDLGREAPDMNPVWRVAISEIHNGTGAAARPELCPDFLLKPAGSLDPASDSIHAAVNLNRDTSTMEPGHPDFFNPPLGGGVDRVIWFTNRDPDTDNNGTVDFNVPGDSTEVGRIFFNRFAGVDYTPNGMLLRGGQYAVIGPRLITPVGSLEINGGSGQTVDPNTNEPLVPFADYESPHRFVLAPDAFAHVNLGGDTTTPTVDPRGGPVDGATIRQVMGVVAAAKPPVGWAEPTRLIGVNISEPIPWSAGGGQYYPKPAESLHPGLGYPVDSYRDYDNGVGELPDRPFDSQAYSELGRAFAGTNGQQTGTRTHFKTAFLQRLADPTQPYHPVDNPYRTVDYIALDLTVFNGSQINDTITDSTPTTEWIDVADPNPFGVAPDEKFATRYKTGNNWDVDTAALGLAANEYANLFHSVNTFPPVDSVPANNTGTHTAIFTHRLNLGATVDPDQGGDVDATTPRNAHSSSLGYLNTSFGQRWGQGPSLVGTMTRYVGLPYDEFGSNVLWFNRPFTSPLELAWVPTSSAGRFAAEFGIASVASGLPLADNDPFNADNSSPIAGSSNRFDVNQQFPHLWNYLSADATDFSMAPNFFRVMDWVEVPTPFDADLDFLSPVANILTTPTQVFPGNLNYNPLSAPAGEATGNPDSWDSTGLPNSPAFWLNTIVTETLRPPFNLRAPVYRGGMINLNTIKSKRVYDALMYGYSQHERFAGSTDSAFWTEFNQSRRGVTAVGNGTYNLASSFDMNVPTQLGGVFQSPHAADVNPIAGQREQPLEATKLRQLTGANRMLFQRDPAAAPVLNTPAMSHERGVINQHLGASRLENLASHQSNVFAVWVTVGMFEVDPANLEVGQEVGYDIGQIERCRGFYIIDRSVPVMYEPGQKNNTADVIQLSRILN